LLDLATNYGTREEKIPTDCAIFKFSLKIFPILANALGELKDLFIRLVPVTSLASSRFWFD
jgi:hypothetical protein